MNTPFVKENFQRGMYLNYDMKDGKYPIFVARFKYNQSGQVSFINFLIKNFTVEEYFDRMENGEAPLTILESKGYLLPHIKRILKKMGYPTTREGYDTYIKDQIEKDRN